MRTLLAAIQAKGLVKSFAPSEPPAVNNLDIEVYSGEAVAFLGPNGAGKSTTIKMLCGILKPDHGEVKIFNQIAGTAEANRNLGLVFGARSQLYFHMTVKDCFELQAEIYFVTGQEQKNQIQDLSDLFGCTHLLKKRVRELSLGERMRCEIVASLLHKPKLILLDEPTIGLDISAKHSLREKLKEWRRTEKVTLLLTSHDLSDVEALCDRCILINKGLKAYDGPLENVRGHLSDVRRIRLILSDSQSLIANTDFTKIGLKEIPSTDPYEKKFEFYLKNTPLPKVMSYLSEAYGDQLEDIQIHGVHLEEVIQKLL